jgi:hypothetical protein
VPEESTGRVEHPLPRKGRDPVDERGEGVVVRPDLDRGLRHSWVSAALEHGMVGELGPVCVDEGVLRIREPNVRERQELVAETLDGHVTPGAEFLGPVLWPATVHVMISTL